MTSSMLVPSLVTVEVAPGTRMLVVSDPFPRLLGPVPLDTGSEVALGPTDPGAVRAIELLDLTVVTIPTR